MSSPPYPSLSANGAGEAVREVDGVDVAPLGRVVGEGHVAVRALGHERHAVVHLRDQFNVHSV